MRKGSDQIMVLADMIAAFDREQPKPGRETTAFIKRWKAEEMKREHLSSSHLSAAVHGINRAEIESIRKSKWARNEPRRQRSNPIEKVV